MHSSISVTAIVNAHREGLLVKPTLGSVIQAVAHAREHNITTEVIIVLDRADSMTRTIVHDHCDAENWRAIEVDHGDLGLSRNDGAKASKGDLVAFLDGDDLWGDNWLTACAKAHVHRPEPIVWHPEVSIYFGRNAYCYRHIDMESEEFNLIDLSVSNPWTALACARRDVFLRAPYPQTDLTRGIGYEDWGWNLRSIEQGVIHKVVPGTGHAIRVKRQAESLLGHTNAVGAVPHPTMLFRKALLRSIPYRGCRDRQDLKIMRRGKAALLGEGG
ncbi:glycosyltransferase family 2 protein [Prosthecodimorpha staleyi]|uniref:Glycosyltransferase family 2 protein n=1 Tax=Prosthecodimorpha staleyi TaxID=2840188 RepID=A0A947DAM3_9HYPH|nr:glycosyltransferase family 2 protein [Prosthecodimorpha staleyi]MBT9293156.1 glycosyltransferase family 2 protein [Prosthecodimorpha staleyi]